MRGYAFYLVIASLLFSAVDRALAQLTPPVPISNPRVFRPRTPGEIKTVEDAMAAVITVTSKDLGLPLVKPLYLHLHNDTEAFAANAGAYGRRLSPEVAKFAVAVAVENRVHVNMEKVRRLTWGALMPTLAHEYAHNIEYIFSSLNRGSQWIREGFAEWVAAKVLDSLAWQEYSTSVHRATLEVQRQKASLPMLSELEDSNRWSIWANGPTGRILTYRFAFLAVAKLMERGGVPGMQKYFATLDFQTQFGIPWSEFQKELKAGIDEIQTPAQALDATGKPEWKVGYQWVYDWKSSGRNGTLTKEVTSEEVLDGLPTFVIRFGDSAEFYGSENLGLVATASKDKFLTKRSVPHEFFSWPLETRKEWKTSFILENVAQKSSQKLAFLKLVSTVEQIRVPAGVFETFKLETYGAESGALFTEQWYSPKARWFVKTRSYLPEGIREEELATFKVD